MGAYADLLPDSSDSANTSSSVARSSGNQRVDAFVEQYRPIAERVAEQTGNDPELYLAKWGLETGWGKSIIPGTNNLGNIKDFSGSGVSAKDNATGSVDRYRQYKDANQFADDYASLLNRRYKNALNVGSDMDTFATELKRAGYAEDPNYVSKLKSAYNMLGGSAAQSDASQPSPNARGEYEPRTDYSAALRQFDKVPNDTYEANRLASTPKGMSISKEISAAIDSYQANLWSIPAAMGSEYALNAMLENKSAAEQQWADSGAPQSFSEMEFGKNFGQYFAHMAIQSAPYMLEFIASGFGVGSLAKGALANTAKGVAEKAAIEAAKQGATKEAAKKAGEVAAKEFMGTVYTASGVAGSYPSAVGDVLSNQYEQSGKFNLPAAAALGVPYAALNAAGAEGMLTRGLARGLPKTSLTAKGAAGFAGRAALTGAEAGLMEGSTETGQEVMNQLGRMAVDPDAKIDDKRALEAYKESFIAGGLLGGVPGAVAGGFRKPEDAKLQPPAPVANSPLSSAVNTAQHVEKQRQQAAVDDHLEQILGMIAQRDDLTERIAGLQNMIDRADPSSEDGQRIRAMQSDMQMRRDSLVAQLDAAKAFYGGDQTANVGPTNDPLILGNEQMSRIYQVTQNLLNDPASLDPESRSGLLKGFSVMRNRTLPEATRIDAAISLIATMDDMAARRAAAASGRADEREWNAFASDEAARDGEASRVAPNQQQGVVTQSAPALATDERARKAAAAEYEAAYQDLVKAEQLGVSDQELMQRQIAMRNAEARLQEINDAIESNRAKETAEKRGGLLDRVLASNPGNPNRAFDRALRLEGFRDSTFTESEKAKIARFNELRGMQEEGISAAPNEAGDFGIREKQPAAPAGRYQHLADMLASGWTQANKHQLVSPRGDVYNLKGAGETQFVRNKLNKKAGNGNQSVRNDPQGSGAKGDLGARGAGIDGAVSESGGDGSAKPSQDQNTATPDGAVQSAEVAGNGGASNGDVAASRQWLSEEDELNAWFGNSLVVGPDGRPMTVYHTTYKVMDEAISEFDRNHLTKINPDTGRRRKSPSLDSVGVWFSNNPAKTDAYGEGAQYPAHLKITRPVVYRTFDDLLKDWNNFHAKGFADPKLAELHQKQNEFFGDADGFVANLKQRGFDGLIILPHERAAAGDNMGSTEFKDQTAYIVFDGSQVRSVFDRRQGESVSAESVEPTIEELQAKLNAAEFGERIELNDILIKRVTADIEQLVSNGEMPAYDTGNGTFIAVHPSAQKEGMIQVTRYSDRGVMGDSQYSNVRDAVRDNSLWFKRKMNKQEAEKAIDNAIIAEADYQEQKREFERNNGKWPESRWFSTREKAQSYILSFGYGRERDGEFRRTNGPIAKIEEGSTGQGGFNVILSEFTGEVEDKLKRVSEVAGKTLNESRQAYKMLIHRLHTGDNGVYKGDYEGAVASANRTLDSTIAIHEQKQAESNKEESAKQEPAQEQEKDAEPKADTSEFEHAGYKIYRSRVNVAGEVKDYWAVQTEDNRQKGKVGFGDALHETKETAMQAANLQSQRADLAERNRIAAEEKAKSEEQAKAEKEADTYNGFLDGKTPAKKGLIRKALSKEMRINGVVSTLRNYVESSLSSGKLEVSTYEEDKIKPLSRTQFNRMDNRQQEAHEKKVREGGKVTVYEVNGYDLGKTAYDYAQHLLSQKDQSVSQQKTDNAETLAANEAPAITPETEQPADTDSGFSTFDYLQSLEKDAGEGFKTNDEAIQVIKEAAKSLTPQGKAEVTRFIKANTAVQRNGDVLIKPAFYDNLEGVFAWTRDFLAAAAKAHKQENSKIESNPAAVDSDFERGKAMMGEGIDKLISLLGGKTNMLPEEEAQIIPVMSQIFRGAALMGYAKFKEASRFVLDTLRNKSPEVADKIELKNLQAAYININGFGSDPDMASVQTVQELYEEREKFQGRIAAAEQRTALNPTEAQKESGVYPKGKFAWRGMTISIETVKGEERSGVDESGQPWSITAPTSYGYFLGTTAADKEHLDVYIGNKPESDRVYVINQTKVDSPKLDEHKILIGFDSEEDAKQAYFSAFSNGFAPRVFGSLAGPFSVDEFKAMLPKLEKSRFIEDRVADKSERLNRLPDGWNGTVGGIATNKDPVRGGIVDKTIATGEWFYVPHDESLETVDGFKSQQEAIDALQKAVEKRAKYLKTTEKFKEKQAERAIVPLDQITVTRSATLDGKAVEYDQKADEALNEIDGQMNLAKRLLECLAA